MKIDPNIAPPLARILVVDDNAMALKACVRVLTQAGYDVAQAGDGRTALEQVRAHRPVLVLLDVVLPDISGNEVLREIKADPELASISVVLLSAMATGPAEQAAGLDAGADGYIPRPIANQELLARVRAELRQSTLAGQLREKESQFRELFDDAPVGYHELDIEGRIVRVNRTELALLDYTETEMIDRPVAEFAPNPVESAATVRAKLAGELPPGTAFERQIRRKDGSMLDVLVNDRLIKDASGRITGIRTSLQDITERKVLEKQVLRAQRLEAVGTLASGIAHDLNNIFTPVLIATGLLKASVKDTNEREMMALVETSVQRGAGIIRQLLTYSRGIKGERVPVDLRHLIEEMSSIARETFPRNITVTATVEPGLWTVGGDVTHLYQVLMNLCVNARDAMPAGGELRIAAANVALADADPLLGADGRPGPFVCLTVSDTGTGISPQIIDKIFDPFFTTKGVGQGSGLGLSTVLGIVRSHDGYTTVDSEPDRGATFRVFLPARDDVVPVVMPVGIHPRATQASRDR